MSKGLLKKFGLLVLMLVSAACIAAEDFPPQNNSTRWQNFGGERGNRGNRGGNRSGNRGDRRGSRGGNRNGSRGNFMELMPLLSSSQRIIAFETTRQKFPKESAELDKFILETEQKYAELAKKSGTELPFSVEIQLIKLRNADPAGYAEAFKAVRENPRSGLRKILELAKKHNIQLTPQRKIGMQEARNIPAPSANRSIQRPDFRKLRTKYPEDMKKYEALRQEKPEQARQMLTEMMKRLNAESEKK